MVGSIAWGTSVVFPLQSIFNGAQYTKGVSIAAVHPSTTDGTNIYAGSFITITPTGGTNPIVQLAPNDYVLTFSDSRQPLRFSVPSVSYPISVLTLITNGLLQWTNFVSPGSGITSVTVTNTATVQLSGTGSPINPIAANVTALVITNGEPIITFSNANLANVLLPLNNGPYFNGIEWPLGGGVFSSGDFIYDQTAGYGGSSGIFIDTQSGGGSSDINLLSGGNIYFNAKTYFSMLAPSGVGILGSITMFAPGNSISGAKYFGDGYGITNLQGSNIAGTATNNTTGSAAIATNASDGNIILSGTSVTNFVTNYVKTVTNNLGSAAFVSTTALTNGFVTASITNGLATTNYVNNATNNLGSAAFVSAVNLTNGFVTASITNGLATTNYVNNATNNLGSAAFVSTATFDAANAAKNATNNLGNAAFLSANTLTNGFVSASITNGLATTNYVNNATNNLGNAAFANTNNIQSALTNYATAVTNGLGNAAFANTNNIQSSLTNYANFVTNGLATTNYVNNATNRLANSAFITSAALTNALVLTNDGRMLSLTNTNNIIYGTNTGTFIGNGYGLTNIPSSAIVGGGGGGLSSVTTANSPTINFSGNGTSGSALTANVTGVVVTNGGSFTAYTLQDRVGDTILDYDGNIQLTPNPSNPDLNGIIYFNQNNGIACGTDSLGYPTNSHDLDFYIGWTDGNIWFPDEANGVGVNTGVIHIGLPIDLRGFAITNGSFSGNGIGITNLYPTNIVGLGNAATANTNTMKVYGATNTLAIYYDGNIVVSNSSATTTPESYQNGVYGFLYATNGWKNSCSDYQQTPGLVFANTNGNGMLLVLYLTGGYFYNTVGGYADDVPYSGSGNLLQAQNTNFVNNLGLTWTAASGCNSGYGYSHAPTTAQVYWEVATNFGVVNHAVQDAIFNYSRQFGMNPSMIAPGIANISILGTAVSTVNADNAYSASQVLISPNYLVVGGNQSGIYMGDYWAISDWTRGVGAADYIQFQNSLNGTVGGGSSANGRVGDIDAYGMIIANLWTNGYFEGVTAQYASNSPYGKFGNASTADTNKLQLILFAVTNIYYNGSIYITNVQYSTSRYLSGTNFVGSLDFDYNSVNTNDNRMNSLTNVNNQFWGTFNSTNYQIWGQSTPTPGSVLTYSGSTNYYYRQPVVVPLPPNAAMLWPNTNSAQFAPVQFANSFGFMNQLLFTSGNVQSASFAVQAASLTNIVNTNANIPVNIVFNSWLTLTNSQSNVWRLETIIYTNNYPVDIPAVYTNYVTNLCVFTNNLITFQLYSIPNSNNIIFNLRRENTNGLTCTNNTYINWGALSQ